MNTKGLRKYRHGTFHKRVAYGQRERKLRLVAKGIMPGFEVVCRTEREARNLAYGLRVRAPRIESDNDVIFHLKVKLDGKKVLVVGMPRNGIQPSLVK